MRFNHVPAWGFGKAKKLEIEKTDPLYNPGPGNYAPKTYKEGPNRLSLKNYQKYE